MRSTTKRRARKKGPHCGPLIHASAQLALFLRRGLDSLGPGGALRLGNARLLAAQSAQIIKLGAAHFAAAHDFDRVDHWRVKREHALNAFAIGDFADGEVLVQAAARAADANALVGLYAALVAFDYLHVDENCVSRLEIRDLLAGRKLLDLLFFQLLNDVHREFSVGSASNRRAVLLWSEWVGELVLQRLWLVTLWIRAGFGPFSRLVGLPQIGAALGGQPLGLGLSPGPDFLVVPGDKDVRDRFPFEDWRPRVLRIFEQAVGKAFLGGGSLLSHDARQKPHTGIQQSQRGDFPARQHEVTE